MPAVAWPVTVQRYSYLPALANVIFNVFEEPGVISVVPLPLQVSTGAVVVGAEQTLKS